MGLRAHLLSGLALCCALLANGPARAAGDRGAAFTLTPAQSAALSGEIARRAARAPAATRQDFTAADLSGDLIFGEEERGADAAGEITSCRGVIVALRQPRRAALRTRACQSLGAAAAPDARAWTVTEGYAAAAAAAGETAPRASPPHDTIEAERSAPPPPSPATLAPASPSQRAPAPGAETDQLGAAHSPTATDKGRGPSAAATRGAGVTPATVGGGVERVITPVLVELAPSEPRFARHGGGSVVLLSEAVADRRANIALCRALFKTFDSATNAEVQAGQRRDDAQLQLLRPLYWPLKDLSKAAVGADKCVHRTDHYDFARAWKIRSKLALTGRGPYLLVARADETRAGLVDFEGVKDADIPDLVRYFRDGFAQDSDIWKPARHRGGADQTALNAFFGRAFRLANVPRLVTVTVLRAGCPLGDLMDVCANPLPKMR